MGTPWDFFEEQSNGDYEGISEQQQENRAFLNRLMATYRFKRLSEEWWPLTLVNEPYPETYFDFEVE